MLLDSFMPLYHFNEVHSIRIHAPPDRIFRAIKALTLPEIRLAHILFWIRALPARLRGKRAARPIPAKPILEVAADSNFLLLAEETNRELVLGTIGQFWRLEGGEGISISNPQEFLAFDRPEYAKAALNFYIDRHHSVSWASLRTETRIYVPDPVTRRKFATYWRVIYPGSALLRRMWLRAIKRRAERELQTERYDSA